MLVNVLVQSDLSAPANGYLQVTIDSTLPVGDLITKFCEAKNLEESSQYCLLNSQNHVLDGKKPISHYGIQSGDKVVFCSVIEKPRQFQSWGLIAVMAVVFSVIGFIVCLGIHLGLVTVPDSYALVLDAGSTHTSVVLYRWPGNKVNNTGIVVQENSCSIKGGIAELTDPANVPGYLDPCVNQLRASIPSESFDHAEIFFGATAGMRVLKEMNETLADDILIQTRKTLHDTGLKFTEDKAEILTGSVEGACGWLTVNYLNNHLHSGAETWGALDLGGASTQISFELKDTEIIPSKNESLVASFQVYGRKVKVYSKSFLCYGLIQAGIRYRSHLILDAASKQFPDGRNITSPCDPAGYTYVYDTATLFKSPCSPRTADSQNETVTGNYTFEGTSNWTECQSTMRYVLSERFCIDYNLPECISINEIPPGFQQTHYMGFSAFGYIDQTIGLGANGTHENYLVAIKSICTRNMAQLYTDFIQNQDQSKPQPRNIPDLCFRSTYMFTLLSDVYQFNTEPTWSNLRFGIKIKEKDLGWALGFMVNETQSIAAAPSRYGMNTLVFILLVILFAVFFFVSTGFVLHALKTRKSMNRTYSSLGLSA